jgi:hypothetical protein
MAFGLLNTLIKANIIELKSNKHEQTGINFLH